MRAILKGDEKAAIKPLTQAYYYCTARVHLNNEAITKWNQQQKVKNASFIARTGGEIICMNAEKIEAQTERRKRFSFFVSDFFFCNGMNAIFAWFNDRQFDWT